MVQLQIKSFPNLTEYGDGWTLRAYASENHCDADGNFTLAGEPGSKEAWFGCALAGRDLTLTLAAGVNYAILGIYDAEDNLKLTLLTDFYVPEQGTSLVQLYKESNK